MDPNNEIIYSSDDIVDTDEHHPTEDYDNELDRGMTTIGSTHEEEDFIEDNNLESNLRRRKGKIISCAKETFENATRQFRRKVPYAGHLMTPRRLWLNKIPTHCDVVIEFPVDAPDEAVRYLLTKIRSQPPNGLGLTAIVKAHESTKRTAFYINAPPNILCKAAEEARLPKRLRPDLGGALREFTTRETHCFAQRKNEIGVSILFTSQERQWLVLQVLQGLRASKTDLEALHGKAAISEGQSIVAAFQQIGIIVQIFPLHETSALSRLQINWVRKLFTAQPLDEIAEYFGVKVALYFAWLGHYTCALGVPAVFGTFLWAVLFEREQSIQDMGHVLFSLFNVAWASLYLEAWRRYSVELAFRWGTLSTPPELLEPPRPLYKGRLVESPLTSKLEPEEAPAWQRRAFRYFVSFPIIGLCLVLVFIVMFIMLRLQDWTDQTVPESGLFSCLSVIPKVLLAGSITLMDEAYFKLAVWLNDKENYRLQSKYENHLIAKVALFQFVNSFLSLFYIAFYLRDEEKLKEQLAGLLISRQIIGNLRESVFPYFMEQLKLAKISFNLWGALSPTQETVQLLGTTTTGNTTNNSSITNLLSSASDSTMTINPNNTKPAVDSEKIDNNDSKNGSKNSPGTPKRSIGQAEIESSLYKYDGTFADHLEMLVQMGYVVLFSAAFPLAGFCALANNLLEIRSDAFKLAHVHQRPFGQRVANIGTWQNALGILGLLAVIVNCALIGLSGQVSRLWPGLTLTQTIILIVALEHIMLGLRSALTWLLPELPSWLAAEIARAEHCRREMQCKGTTPRPTPPSPSITPSISQQDQVTTDDLINDTNEQSIESQIAEDIIFEHIAPISPKFRNFQDLLMGHQNDSSLDTEILTDSPTEEQQLRQQSSQTITSSVRNFLQESPPPSINGNFVQHHFPLEIPPYTGACKDCNKPNNLNAQFEIPPFRGSRVQNSVHASSSGPSTTSSAFHTKSQPIQIPEIPPFRKKQQNNQKSVTTGITTATTMNPLGTSKIAEIPAYKPRKSNDWLITQITSNTIMDNELQHQQPHHHHHHQHQHHTTVTTQQSSGGGGGSNTPPIGPEWVRRLKGDSSTVHHRSIDCIVNKELATSSDTDLLKNAPSWTNVSVRNESVVPASSSAPSTTIDDEAKAVELAAKKSRVKQSLIKRARSVAIFSLKLKERRAKEAEKQAQYAAEHAKQMAPAAPPGGELDLIGIEQLIQIDDVIQHISPTGTSTM